MRYIKSLSEPWFSLMKLGIKTREGRLNKGDFSKMKKDDIITFIHKKRFFECKIVSIRFYKTFKDYLETEGLQKCLPGVDTIKEGIEIYHQFYKKEDEKNYGILSIRIKV